MKTQQYLLEDFSIYFKRHKIATLDQLKKALGNPQQRTIFRKLKSLDYLSSYSHRGMYYTLQSITVFNDDGLWSYRSVWFSRFGSLLDTAKAFIENSEAGYTAVELQEALHVETKHCLLKLTRARQLRREKLQGSYVYFCSEPNEYYSQLKVRKQRKDQPFATMLVTNPDLAAQEAKAAVLLFCSMLNERQRRLYAGLESLKLGYGGDAHIASLLGMDPHTVARGRQEIISGDLGPDGIRSPGGGRLPQEKKRPKS